MKKVFLSGFMSFCLGGCFGIDTPIMEEIYESYGGQRLIENVIINHVKCELRQGLEFALNDDLFLGYKVDWLRNYGAKVTLKITADEKASANPSITLKPRQFFNLGLGGSVSANATRAESLGFTYDFQALLKNQDLVSKCPNSDGFQINSNLKIAEFMRNKVFVARVPGTTYPNGSASPFNTFNYEATFVSSYGGSFTPTWTFTDILASGNPLLNSMRTKTHYLTITLGPAIPGTRTRPPILYPQAEDVHIASLIGQSVANAIASQQR